MPHRKSLLLVTQDFPFGESEIGFLAQEFSELQRCFKITVLTYGKSSSLAYPVSDQVALHQYEFSAIQPWKLLCQVRQPEVWADCKCACKTGSAKMRLSRVGKILAYSLRAQQLEPQMQEIIETQKIDIVYTYWCTQATIAALRLETQFPLLKVVTRLHGYDLFVERTDVAWQPLRSFVAKKCERLYFVCNAGREYFRKQWPLTPEDKCTVAYLGTRSLTIDLENRSLSKQFSLVSCSNVIPLKRVDLIAEALVAVPEEIQVKWTHIGGGDNFDATVGKVAQLLINSSNIQWEFLGQVFNKDLEEIYRRIQPQLFISTSSTEGGAPVSIQEVFSFGIPAIGTTVGGIPELILDGITGFLLSENPTPEEIAQQIVRFYNLTQEHKAEMQGAIIKLWHEKYDAEKNAKAFVEELSLL